MTTIKAWIRRPDGTVAGETTGWTELSVVERWHDVGAWTLVTANPVDADLLGTHGAGIIITRDGSILTSGPVRYMQRDFRAGQSTWTFAGPDDTDLLARVLAWPNPTLAIGSQPADDVRTGVAETILLAYITANAVTRLGLDLTVPATGGRGTSQTYRARFTPLLQIAKDVLVNDQDVGFRVVWDETERGLTVDVWEAADLSDTSGFLSDQTGTALDWSYREEWPKVTRVIGGAGDEGAARLFRIKTDTAAETLWVATFEGFTDARSIDPADGTAAAELDQAIDTALDEGKGVQALTLNVTDTPGLVYGVDYRVGDLVSAYPAGVQVIDRISEATVTVTRSEGERTSLWVGPKDDNDDPLERLERRAARFGARLQQLERSY